MTTMWKTSEKLEICNHCGRSVLFGSGLYVNRVLDLNDITTRIENSLNYPVGDFVCIECDTTTSDEYQIING